MSLIEIRPPASRDEYEDACALVETVYGEHGIAPEHRMTHPRANLLAVQDGVVLGSLGFRSADQGMLPSEYLFGFDAADVCGVSRGAVGEIVKLAARERADYAVFRGLVAAISRYAFVEHGFGVLLAITKPKLERAINRLLHVPSWAPVCQMVHERARAENPHYFLEGGCPRPICFTREDYPSYGPTLLRQIDGKVIVETESFDHEHDYSLPASRVAWPDPLLGFGVGTGIGVRGRTAPPAVDYAAGADRFTATRP